MRTSVRESGPRHCGQSLRWGPGRAVAGEEKAFEPDMAQGILTSQFVGLRVLAGLGCSVRTIDAYVRTCVHTYVRTDVILRVLPGLGACIRTCVLRALAGAFVS